MAARRRERRDVAGTDVAGTGVVGTDVGGKGVGGRVWGFYRRVNPGGQARAKNFPEFLRCQRGGGGRS